MWTGSVSEVEAKVLQGKCKLCLKQEMLQDSHLLPRAIYKYLRGPKRDETPRLLTGNTMSKSTKQIHDYVLCGDCEQLFSKNGEQWMIGKMARPKKFELRDMLNAAIPFWSVPGAKVYNARAVLGADFDKFVYFALSVFWRASVHTWIVPDSEQRVRIHLGSFGERIRLFLLGHGSFPADVTLSVCVSPELEPPMATFGPIEERKVPFHNFVFHIPGVEYQLNVGKMISADARLEDIHRSPDNPIFLTEAHSKRLSNTAIALHRQHNRIRS